MNCELSLGEYDGDAAICYEEKIVKARKPHRCYECHDTIPAGEQYERVSGIWEGKWETYHFCLPCREIAHEFSEGAIQFGVMWEDFHENWSAGANLQACLNRVSSVAAKTKLRDEWVSWKGL